MDSHGLSWTLMVKSYVQIQAVFSKLHLSWTLMDSHGLSWQDLVPDQALFPELHLSWPLIDSHGLPAWLHGRFSMIGLS